MMRALFSALTPLALALAAAIVSARAEATDAAAPASARGMPDMDLTHSLRARLAAWLLGPAPVRDGMPVLFPAFCNQLVRAALPIWRASLGLETLHPEASGRGQGR